MSYTDESVQTLDYLQHIRLRYGMYIGRKGTGSHPADGIYILLKESIDNSIDEFIMGNGELIDITLKNNKVSVRDYGRGIPLNSVVSCSSQMNTGAKYFGDAFQLSAGLNGVGLKAVNALSQHLYIRSVRNLRYSDATYQRGVLVASNTDLPLEGSNEENGTFISFTPDPEIFGDYAFNESFVLKRLWYYAFLNKGLTLRYNGEDLVSQNGLLDLLTREIDGALMYPAISYTSPTLEYHFTHTPSSYGETYFSFVNGQHTLDGGSHLSAFREGILKGVNSYAKKDFNGSDVRESICGAISFRCQDPVFENQTKTKLGMTEIKSGIISTVCSMVEDYLHRNPQVAQIVIDKITYNERVRKELGEIKATAKKRSKSVSVKIPKLRDCRYHLQDGDKGTDSTLFITEGDSASGSIISARNVETQAVFSVRGKSLNTLGSKLEVVYKNEELYNIMKALNIEEGISGLRYNKIVLATDADVDGLHIRNLLITFFMQFFEPLISHNHVYILETPLYRVRDSKTTLYCYSDKERDKALKKLKSPEMVRFKGLGEISPKEFSQFIGNDIRLIPVSLIDRGHTLSTLQFVMGDNTPDRKKYLMNHLNEEGI